jgi:hypothetical protein
MGCMGLRAGLCQAAKLAHRTERGGLEVALGWLWGGFEVALGLVITHIFSGHGLGDLIRNILIR